MRSQSALASLMLITSFRKDVSHPGKCFKTQTPREERGGGEEGKEEVDV